MCPAIHMANPSVITATLIELMGQFFVRTGIHFRVEKSKQPISVTAGMPKNRKLASVAAFEYGTKSLACALRLASANRRKKYRVTSPIFAVATRSLVCEIMGMGAAGAHRGLGRG